MGPHTLKIAAALIFLASSAGAQTVPRQWNWPVSSDFGPRLVPGWGFHEGVDFDPIGGPGTNPDADLGTPIPNLDAGPILAIANNATFIEIRVHGLSTAQAWFYGHIFQNESDVVAEPAPSTYRWELRRNVELVLPSDTSNRVRRNIIIRWSGNRALVVWSPIGSDGRWVLNPDGTTYVQDANGNAVTRDSPGVGEVIAPMGDAGTGNVHLHLGLNYPNNNPFYELQHDPENLPAVTIENPPAGKMFSAGELATPLPVKVTANSVGGLDLDDVSIFIYENKDPLRQIHLGDVGQPTFGYGGKVSGLQTDAKTATVVASNGSTTGVQPLDADSSRPDYQPGHDRFIFLQDMNSLNLPEGEHSLVVKCHDVNNHEGCQGALVNFRIATTPPTLWVIDGAGKVLNDIDSTQNSWVNISAQLSPSNTPLKRLAVFLDTDYPTPVATALAGSTSLGFSLQPNIWYWAQACDVAGNCVESSFVLIPPGGTKPTGPGGGPGGPKQPPHPPTSPQPPCLITSVTSCVSLPNVPGGPGVPIPHGWPPPIPYPGPIQFLVPGDPNSLHGPEGSVTPGQLMIYTAEFENVGDGIALGVYVKDVLDPNLDDTTLTVRDMNTHVFVDDVPVSTTPANFPWSYDPRTRTITVLTGNAGPNQGGSFVIETRLKATSPPGTVVTNQALVFFPNALQTITPTNTVISAVPLPTQLEYVGVSSGTFLDTASLAARLTTSSGPALRQAVSFHLAGLTADAKTDTAGTAAASVVLSTAAGDYSLAMNYPVGGTP